MIIVFIIYTDEIGVIAELLELIEFLFIELFDGVVVDGVATAAAAAAATFVPEVEQTMVVAGVWITSLMLA